MRSLKKIDMVLILYVNKLFHDRYGICQIALNGGNEGIITVGMPRYVFSLSPCFKG